MRKSLEDARASDRKRVNKWRKKFTEDGGKFLQIPLDKRGIACFAHLKKHYHYKKTNGEVIFMALAALKKMTKEIEAETK